MDVTIPAMWSNIQFYYTKVTNAGYNKSRYIILKIINKSNKNSQEKMFVFGTIHSIKDNYKEILLSVFLTFNLRLLLTKI